MGDQKGTLLLLAIAGGYILLYFGLLLILALCQVNPPLGFVVVLSACAVGFAAVDHFGKPRPHLPPPTN